MKKVTKVLGRIIVQVLLSLAISRGKKAEVKISGRL
jgi:hypothetical protein